jgi:uncharacterized protein (DUF1684 family)
MQRYFISGLFILLGLAGAALAQNSTASPGGLETWRAEREAKLKAEDGWLTVAGLFWLKEGVNTVGTAADNNIVLPTGSAPARAGTFELRAGKTFFHAAAGVSVTANEQPVRDLEVKSDEVKQPDVLKLNDLTLLLLKRGDRYAIRLKDKNTPTRRAFTGLRWYAGQAAYRVTAQFIPYEQPKEVSLVNIIGDIEKMKSPGYVVFTLNGQELSLEPVTAGRDKLFFIFRDLTSGKTTYKPGRFLYAAAPADLSKAGPVVLDFNQAINPPCAFTAFATCPLPPKRNHLAAAVEAGERLYFDPTRNHEVAAVTAPQAK